MSEPKLLSSLSDAIHTECTFIDRHTCKRVVPMEVLSLGMSRTGTLSMKVALDILGYGTAYHFSEIYINAPDVDMWMEALNAKYKGIGKPFKREQWDQLLGHCGAVTDTPCNIFGEELMEAYPEAKVVLVDRDMNAWFKSFDMIADGVFETQFTALAFTDPVWMGRLYRLTRGWAEMQFNAKTAAEMKGSSKEVFVEHYKHIRSICPKEKLLEYKLGSGWEPLCKFLGKPIPDVPFPHINEAASLKQLLQDLGMKSVVRSLGNITRVVAPMVIAGAAIWWGLKKSEGLEFSLHAPGDFLTKFGL